MDVVEDELQMRKEKLNLFVLINADHLKIMVPLMVDATGQSLRVRLWRWSDS